MVIYHLHGETSWLTVKCLNGIQNPKIEIPLEVATFNLDYLSIHLTCFFFFFFFFWGFSFWVN